MVLGTIFTMQADFYQSALNKYSIEVIGPNKEEQEYVNSLRKADKKFGLKSFEREKKEKRKERKR